MRAGGILMHITSLPGPYGVGTMGKAAYQFVDFLEKAGQRYWQVLPLTPTGYGDSPYQSCSAFAGNPYLIDLDMLVQEGLLETAEITACNWGADPDRVDYGLLYENRIGLLQKAYSRFREDAAFSEFCFRNENWLPEFAHFMALKEQFEGKPWYAWPDAIKHRQVHAVNES
ncbi:MAG: 4-alpha-glucanotransferase, partial [Lentisphaeria bacterium]|nr:4-alpha-glucanotransferase [Lentisphaeria bacterium]